jgi:Protein of unknown function (DUF3108)
MKLTHKIALSAAFLVLLVPAWGFPAEPLLALDEEFQYRWQLSNFVGSIAALFLPGQGDGSLTFKTSNGHLRSELMITSTESEQGEYFRYGSEIDRQTLQPIRAWSAYSWRGESKSKTEEVSRNGALDIAAGIFAIRNDPPVKTRQMEIWSDGRTYSVLVIPRGRETRKLPAGIIETRHFAIRGMDIPGRNRWKGKLDLWLATNAAATPVEIVISRNLADVRLELKSLPRTSP